MTPASRWKMIFGFALLMIVAALALAIALGKVEEKTSYGLLPVLTMLGVLVGNFANWAFGHHGDQDDKGNTDGRSE